MGLVIVFGKKMHIVGRDQPQTHFLGKLNQRLAKFRIVIFMPLNFNKEPVFAEYL